jgi:hypothetical protein
MSGTSWQRLAAGRHELVITARIPGTNVALSTPPAIFELPACPGETAAEASGPEPPPDAGEPASPHLTPPPNATDGGCSCRTAPFGAHSSGVALIVLGFVTALMRSRQRQRSA